MNENKVILELNPLEAGLLLGVMIKEMSSDPVNNNFLEPVYKRLIDAVDKEYYKTQGDGND